MRWRVWALTGHSVSEGRRTALGELLEKLGYRDRWFARLAGVGALLSNGRCHRLRRQIELMQEKVIRVQALDMEGGAR
jgi:hypothetical protein